MRVTTPLLLAFLLFPTSALALPRAVVLWDGDGPFSSQVDFACEDSPIGWCTFGELSGTLNGTYEFVFESLSIVEDPERGPVQVFTGYSIITLDDGVELLGIDEGEMWGADPFATPFITRVGVYEGDLFDGVEGTVVATGFVDLVNNFTDGSYESDLYVTCPRLKLSLRGILEQLRCLLLGPAVGLAF